MPACSFPSCDRPAERVGLCFGHYSQQRRGKTLQPLHSTKTTHCVQGHAYTPENTRLYFMNGKLRQRHCLTCCRARSAARSAELKQAEPQASTLDRKALLRLLDARRDGVSLSDLRDRFGAGSVEQVMEWIDEAKRAESFARAGSGP